MNARELEKAIRRSQSDGDRDAVMRTVLGSPDPRSLVEELARSRSFDARSWALEMATMLPMDQATLVLSAIARRSRDADDRIDALRRLARINPNAARAFSPTIRHLFSAKDAHDRQLAMQTAVAIGDIDSLAELDEIAARDPYATGRIAGVCAMALRGDLVGLRTRLLGHADHYDTPWLTQALAIIGTQDAMDILRAAMHELPDEECRAFAASSLE